MLKKFSRPGERMSNFDIPRPAGPVIGPPRRRTDNTDPNERFPMSKLKTPLRAGLAALKRPFTR